MKLHAAISKPSPASSWRGQAAFTLIEVLTVAGIFAMLLAAAVTLQLFGLRLYRISETKLTATDSSRRVLNRIRGEVRSGKLLFVGNGDSKSFSLIADSQPHVGNALKICPTADSNNFVYYYLDSPTSCLNRMTSSNTAVEVVSRFITNRMVFQAEDFQGNVVTNYFNNRVIRMTLEYYQWEYPIVQAGANCMYDYFHLQTKMARRLIE
jgi:prepilin-type N-terminal cleavage/methylation domain-containing protein